MQFKRFFVAAVLSLAAVGLFAGCSSEPLSGQELLADVARNADDPAVRLSAAEQLDEQHRAVAQEVFADLAIHAFHANVKQRAVRRLTDPALLAKVAKTANDSDVSRAALQKLAEVAEAEAAVPSAGK